MILSIYNKMRRFGIHYQISEIIQKSDLFDQINK